MFSIGSAASYAKKILGGAARGAKDVVSQTVTDAVERGTARANVAVQHIANQGGLAAAEGFWSSPQTRKMVLIGGGVLVAAVMVAVIATRRR